MTVRRILAAGCAAATILLISVPIAVPAAATVPCITGTFGAALPGPGGGLVLDGSVAACADAPAGSKYAIARYQPGAPGVLATSMMQPYAVSSTASFRIWLTSPAQATTLLLCLLDHRLARLACHRIDFDALGGFTAQPLDVHDPLIPNVLRKYNDSGSGDPPDGNCGSCLGWVH